MDEWRGAFNRAAFTWTAAAVAVVTLASGMAAPQRAAQASGPATVAGCPSLPSDNAWNARVDTLPVHPQSSAYLSSIGLGTGLKADFGSGLWDGGPIGIPFVTVPGNQARVPVTFTWPGESDPGPYPVPPNPPIEGGPNATGDRHILVVDRDNCVLYELFSAYPRGDGGWNAGSGAVFPLTSNALRPAGWTSADAAGLPILPGLVRYDEVAGGEIAHAIRFTAQVTQHAYTWPARHYASSNTNPNVPPMGIRVRLNAGYDISGFSARNQVILRALKTYGMYLADNGSNWYVSGVPDERWNNGELQQLRNVLGSAFEVVDQSPLMVSPNSGQVAGAAGPTATVPVPSATLAVSSPTQTTPPPASPTQTGTPIPSATRTPTPSRTATGTRTSTPVPAATWTATPSASPTLPPPGTTRSLVLRGASQMPDTWISPDYPSSNFGSTGSAHLQGAYTPDRLLFRPNLGALPVGATIQSATLQVYAYSATSSGNTLSAYRVLAPWGSSTATYSSPWSQPGLQAGTDYVAVADGTALLGGAGWLTVDVTAAVRAWQQGATNNGIMLRLSGGASGAHYRVYMAESTTNQRPALSISYTAG